MLADADMLIVRPFDDLVDGVLQAPAFAGLIAHVSPFRLLPEPPEEWWCRVFSSAGLPKPELVCEHPGWGVMDEATRGQHCPPYFNLGMLLAPREIMSRLGEVIYGELEAVNRVLESMYRCQIAVSLALARTGVPWRTAPMRYNYPNIPQIAAHYRADLYDAQDSALSPPWAVRQGEGFSQSSERAGASLSVRMYRESTPCSRSGWRRSTAR